jgi:hypothetical protein
MSKGKELKYSVNRSFEEIKLQSSRDVLIPGVNSQHSKKDIQSFVQRDVLHSVSDSELIKIDFSITGYSNIEQALG